MIFAFLLLSALIITEYTAQPTQQHIADQHTIIDSKQKAKTPAKVQIVSMKSATVQPPEKQFEFITLTPILFDFDQSKLHTPSKKSLDKVVALISATRGVERLFIEGNTDHIGGVNYNDQLSDLRATSVKKYLLEKGVPETLFAESGYGEMRPIDEYWTRNGKQRNRHVSLHMLVSK